MLTIVEKVLILQDVDIFKNTSTEDLAHIAAISEEVGFKSNTDIFRDGEISDSMYLVIEGSVRLHKDEKQLMIAKHKDVFGTWALFDDKPRIATASTLEETSLLRIDREAFFDLLADHTKITQGVLKTLSERLRNLLRRVKVDMD